MVVTSPSDIAPEVYLSMFAVVTCCALSSLSKSAFKWSLLLLVGLVLSFTLGLFGLYELIWYVDLFMLMSMWGLRQELNREWQTVVMVLQLSMTALYGSVALFSGKEGWSPNKAVDLGNALYMVQLVVVGFIGFMLSRRNYLYVRKQRQVGNKLPWRTMWRMT